MVFITAKKWENKCLITWNFVFNCSINNFAIKFVWSIHHYAYLIWINNSFNTVTWQKRQKQNYWKIFERFLCILIVIYQYRAKILLWALLKLFLSLRKINIWPKRKCLPYSIKKTTGKPIKWIICLSPVLSNVFFTKELDFFSYKKLNSV